MLISELGRGTMKSGKADTVSTYASHKFTRSWTGDASAGRSARRRLMAVLRKASSVLGFGRKRLGLGLLGMGGSVAGAGIAVLIAFGSSAIASDCGDGSTVASGGSCAFAAPNFNPVDNDNQAGAVIVDSGETVTLRDVGTNIVPGSIGASVTTLNDPSAYGPGANLPSLTTGSKTVSVSSPDPVTGGVVTVATFASSSFVQGNIGASPVTIAVPVGDNQYIDARFGTVDGSAGGGTLRVDIGDAAQSASAAVNRIEMRSKDTTLTLADGADSHVEWASKNLVVMDMATSLVAGGGTGSASATVANFGGTFTAFDGSSWTVTNAAEMQAYNNFLVTSLQSGALNSQAGYDAAFAQGVTFTPQTFNWVTPLPAGDDSLVPQGQQYIIHADGVGATGTIVAGGQIDHRLHGNVGGAALYATNGGHVEIEAGAKLSGHYVSVRVDGASGPVSTATNNGVISGGYFSGDDWDTSVAGAYPGYSGYVEAQTVLVNGASAQFDNNGIINVAGRTFGNGGGDYGVFVIGGVATNSGIVNVGVNTGITAGSVSGAMVASNGSFTNEASGQIYIGRAAQYDVFDMADTGADVANSIAQYGINLINGHAQNDGNITIGSLTQNASALYTANTTGTASSLINTGTIDINGAATGVPLQNIGISAINSGPTLVQNEGTITLSGVNGVGVKALSTGAVATNVTLTDSSVINVAGGSDPTSGTRNFGVWVEGAGSALSSADISGDINLTGTGAIGIHARGNSDVSVSASAVPNFISGTDQIGFFIYGPNATIDVAASAMDVSTDRSTLFRIAEGADFDASGTTLTASGAGSVALLGTGAGTEIHTQDGVFNLTGDGATAVVIEGGATGDILPVTSINLNGPNTVAGIVDGQKHDLLGAPVGAPDPATLLTNAADITSNQPGVTGFVARNLGTLDTVGDITLAGTGSTGILAQDSGNVLIDGSLINVNGWATKAQGGTDTFTITNASLFGTEGLFDVSDSATATFSADASSLTGRILTEAGSTSDVSLTGGTVWNMNADSNVTNLLNSASTINFTPPVGGAFKTLTVEGNYTGANGTLLMNTYLDTDGSPSDILHVIGDTAGTSSIFVTNAGGPGAATRQDGILLVDVDGASNGTFGLSNPAGQVIAGAYGYRLFKNGLAGQDGNWYLRSIYIGPEDPVDPTDPELPPLYQPGVPVYEAYPQVLLGLNGLPTLQQRVGNRYWKEMSDPQSVFCKDASKDFKCTVTDEQAAYYEGSSKSHVDGRGVWTRIEAAHGKFEPDSSTSRTDYDTDQWRLQSGVDGKLYESAAGDTLIGGITVHYGEASADVNSVFGDGGIDTKGYGFGGTLTWYGANGFYVDGQAQATWYDSDLNSSLLGGLTNGNDGFGYALSLEAGKRIELRDNWSVTPQAQLVYSSVDFDTFTGPSGERVSLTDGESLNGRLGVSLDHEQSWKDEQGKTRRAHVYGIGNLYYEFLNGTSVDVSGAGFRHEPEKLWGGIGLGGSYNWNDDKYSIYGEVSTKTSLSNFGDSYSLNGTAGFRVKF